MFKRGERIHPYSHHASIRTHEVAMSTSPMQEYRTNQYEFTDEQNKTISQLADGMGGVALLMKLLGLAFLVLFGLTIYNAIQMHENYAPAAGLGAGALLALAIGFWTGNSAHSFRRIVETKNEDVWHLMNALEGLRNMYGLLRGIVLLSLVLLMVGLGVTGYIMSKSGG
jgi:hypothetical protein